MAGPAGAVRPVEKGVHPIPAMEPARCLEAHIDWHIYKERHLAEILFLKFKARCRFSTRYEKRAYLFLCHDCTAKRLELPLQRLPAVSRVGQPQPTGLQNALNKCAQSLSRKTKKKTSSVPTKHTCSRPATTPTGNPLSPHPPHGFNRIVRDSSVRSPEILSLVRAITLIKCSDPTSQLLSQPFKLPRQNTR